MLRKVEDVKSKISHSFRDKSLEEAEKFSLPWFVRQIFPHHLIMNIMLSRYTFGSFDKFERSSRGLFICPSCKQEYRKSGIRRHIQFMHVNSKKPGYPKSKCDQCGKEVGLAEAFQLIMIFLFRFATSLSTLNKSTPRRDLSNVMCVDSPAAKDRK